MVVGHLLELADRRVVLGVGVLAGDCTADLLQRVDDDQPTVRVGFAPAVEGFVSVEGQGWPGRCQAELAR